MADGHDATLVSATRDANSATNQMRVIHRYLGFFLGGIMQFL